MASSDTSSRRQLPVFSFFALAFAWSWVWWWMAATIGVAVTEPPGLLLYQLGVFGLFVGAAWVVHRGGSGYRREFLRRSRPTSPMRTNRWIRLRNRSAS